MGVGERCIDADTQGIKLVFCRLGTVDGHWQYDEVSNILNYPKNVFVPKLILIWLSITEN